MVFVLFDAEYPHIRSKGYGSAILEIIKREHPDKVLTLNIEPLDCNADNYEQRKSRLAFYERNGFCVTDYVINDTGEDYTILSSSPNYAVEDFKKAVRKLSFGLYKPNIRKHR